MRDYLKNQKSYMGVCIDKKLLNNSTKFNYLWETVDYISSYGSRQPLRHNGVVDISDHA